MSNKDSPVGGSWVFRAQVIHDRLAGLRGQWKNVAEAQFTHREPHVPFFPINAIQPQLDDLGCAQAEVSGNEESGTASPGTFIAETQGAGKTALVSTSTALACRL
jgi:hypothetical protein